MIISRTPFRVSLFGGGSDYPDWYLQHGGAVIGSSINKYCYLTVRQLPPFFEHKNRIVYSKVELTDEVEDIEHPAVKGVLSDYKITQGMEIHHYGDLPARSGLGSSSSFTVGLLNAIRGLQGKLSSPQLLASEAIRIEQQVIQEHVGSQDQIWAAHGGTNFIEFKTDGSFAVSPLVMRRERAQALNSHCVLLFTGLVRIAAQIAEQKISNLDKRQQQIHSMIQMAYEARDILQNTQADICDIGHMLHDAWQLKRELADGISNDYIDDIYKEARAAGALGGKLLGAGGGGFMLLFVPPEKQQQLLQRLNKLIPVDFTFGSCGSKIVMYEPNGLESI